MSAISASLEQSDRGGWHLQYSKVLGRVLLLPDVKDLEGLLGGLDAAQRHGAESRSYDASLAKAQWPRP